MKLALAENIRMFRKQRKMTQEQLAAALGVTVGAVYKWESGLSVPELNMLVEIADFFDLSVDALLGCRMKDNRLESVLGRLATGCQTLDPEAPAEAEKALGRYPHSFQMVYMCAGLYLTFGMGRHDPQQLRRALELYEQALVLLPQNREPRVNEAMVCRNMAIAFFGLGEKEKAVDLLKQNNAGGFLNSEIGSYLAAFMDRTEEAAPYLSEAMVKGMSDILTAVLGYVFVFRSRKDWDSLLAIITWADSFVAGLRAEDATGFMDKTQAEFLLLLAYAQGRAGMREASGKTLRKAAESAFRFDRAPEYTLKTMRFIDNTEQTTAFDTLGATASESIGLLLSLLEDRELAREWKEVSRSE